MTGGHGGGRHGSRGFDAAASGEDVERRLRAAFDAHARAAVGEHEVPPPPRFAAHPGASTSEPAVRASAWGPVALPPAPAHPGRRPGRTVGWVWPVAAAAVVVLVAGIVALVGVGTPRPSHQAAAPSPAVAAPTRGGATSIPPRHGTGQPVRIAMSTVQQQPVGVGLPVIAYFSRRPTEGTDLARATTVTVDGRPVQAAWYFERSAAHAGFPVEGHLRMQHYWPADSQIQVRIAARDVSAGTGLRYDDSVTAGFTTTAAVISTVDAATHRMTVQRDGRTLGSFPVSLGSARTPTTRGTKVIMEKGASVCMSGPGYDECGVKYTQRLTYGGEYLAAAPWNAAHIQDGVDTSDGCTDLMTDDAARLYSLLRVGDVVNFPNADGPAMTMAAGYGDWNVPWSVWQQGGLVPTS